VALRGATGAAARQRFANRTVCPPGPKGLCNMRYLLNGTRMSLLHYYG